jgi:phospholipase D1/2
VPSETCFVTGGRSRRDGALPGLHDARSRTSGPRRLQPDLEQCEVGVMRTQPSFAGQAEVREIERAYLEAIKRARQSIYIESQYFTSQAIGRALAARLSEHEGPEVVLVLRHNCDGWLERRTMDSVRAKVLHDLELADHYGRLSVYAPTVPGSEGSDWVAIHSKLLIVDDEFVCVGSANVSNRSMGFDTECNLAVEARNEPGVQAVIAGTAEPTDRRTPRRRAYTGDRRGAALRLIDPCHHGVCAGGRGSLESGCFTGTDVPAVIPEQRLVDPERAMGMGEVLGTIVPVPGTSSFGPQDCWPDICCWGRSDSSPSPGDGFRWTTGFRPAGWSHNFRA